MTDKQWFFIGTRDGVRAALEREFGSAPGPAEQATEVDGTVVIDAVAGLPATADLFGGHAFGGVLDLKRSRERRSRVAVVVDQGDDIGPQLARFCLADAVLVWDPLNAALDCSELEAGRARAGGRPSVDELLARLEQKVTTEGGRESTVQRLLRFESQNPALQTLQDPDTGLFDGPYATWKLDEEWKRSQRFHQPLSLVLLDIGDTVSEMAEPDRRVVLADAASVFLNECRDIDVLSRFTPSTFLFLLPGTGADGATILAQRMIDQLQERLPPAVKPQLAAGVATAPHAQIPHRKAFLAVAEACLERAREAPGGGQVETTWQ